MKLNLGCGLNKIQGFINIDKFDTCNPDVVMDIEVTPWSFENDSVDEILLNHCLEHIGQDVNVFFSVVKELYRVCKQGALIQINVPHPRHDNFINDPTHVRIITPELLGLFSKANCKYWAENGGANSPLAIYLNVDFEIRDVHMVLEEKYLQLLSSKEIDGDQLNEFLASRNNVASEYRITLEVIK